MKHIPHLIVGAPWVEDDLRLSVLQIRHLSKVLKLGRGDRVSYTDGLGTIGDGMLGHQVIRRGDEREIPRHAALDVAVAPPKSKDRQRFLVEKLAELGVARLRWLRTSHGKNRAPSAQKTFAWSVAAIEQSRGAWLMESSPEMCKWDDLEKPILVCHPGGQEVAIRPRTVVIGPEGGFADDEIPDDSPLWDLGPNILRVETAATVAAARLLSLD